MEYNPNSTVILATTPVEQHRKEAMPAMILGIISLALSWEGISSIAALILAIIGFSRARKNREFARSMGLVECGQNRAGYICNLIGLIVSIVAIVTVFVVWIILAIFWGSFLSESLPGFFDAIQQTILTSARLITVL